MQENFCCEFVCKFLLRNKTKPRDYQFLSIASRKLEQVADVSRFVKRERKIIQAVFARKVFMCQQLTLVFSTVQIENALYGSFVGTLTALHSRGSSWQ